MEAILAVHLASVGATTVTAMRTRTVLAGLLVLMLGLAACGDDDGGDVADSSTSSTTTADPGDEGDEGDDTTTTTTGEEGECPVLAEIPDGATEVTEAALAFDGDGDGEADTLSTFFYEDMWWLQVEWAAGGNSAVTIDEVGSMGATPIGGHDLDDDGGDEAFVRIAGPASGVIVAVFYAEGCSILPIIDDTSGLGFSFPVTASIGAFSGASCDGMGHIDIHSGELVDADTGEYLVSTAPHTLTDGRMLAEMGDAGSVEFDDIGRYSGLACGDLGSGL